MTKIVRYVSYLRVSTQAQGASGLGLEAQRESIANFVGSSSDVIAEYVEVESGKRADRPQLIAALEHAKRERATLLIAKLDRLARNVAFIANLLEAGVDVTAVDLPEANRFLFHIMAAVAEQEAKAISDRTKAALAATKRKGTRLGWSNPKRRDQPLACKASQLARKSKADAFAARHGPAIQQRRMQGLTLAEISNELNHHGVQPPRQGLWWPATVSNVLKRHQRLEEQSET